MAKYVVNCSARTWGYAVAKELLKVMPRDTKSPTLYLDKIMENDKSRNDAIREFGVDSKVGFDEGVREAVKEYRNPDYRTRIHTPEFRDEEIAALNAAGVTRGWIEQE